MAAEFDFSGLQLGEALSGQPGDSDSAGVAATGDWTRATNSYFVLTSGSLGTAGSETSEEPYPLGDGFFGGARIAISGLDTAGTFWISTLIQVDDGGGAGGFGGVQLFRGESERILLGRDWNGTQFVAKRTDRGTAATSPAEFDFNTTYLVVAEFSAAGNEMNLWINPDLNLPAPPPDATAAYGPPDEFDNLRLRSGGPEGDRARYGFDNLYVGNESPFATVPPATEDFRITEFRLLGDDVVLAWVTAPGRSYVLATSDDLATWTDIFTLAPAPDLSFSRTITGEHAVPAAGHRFYRIEDRGPGPGPGGE